MTRSARWALAGLMAATMVLGACGDGGDDDGTPATGTTSASGTGSGAGVEGVEQDEHAGHGSDDEAPFANADADTTVRVTMKDFAFAGLPTSLKGEKVLFEVLNEGPSEHEFVVFENGDEVVRGIKPFAKGKTQMLAVELSGGSYTAKCLVKLGDQTHADLGMQTEFTVG